MSRQMLVAGYIDNVVWKWVLLFGLENNNTIIR